MAYLDVTEAGVAAPAVHRPIALQPVREEDARLGVLEWAVVALARRDRLSSIVTSGRLVRLLRLVFGREPDRPLANERLEALRRTALLLWRRDVPLLAEEVEAFLAAGFSRAQFDLIAASIATRRRNGAQEVFA